jgi:hypothetical protein
MWMPLLSAAVASPLVLLLRLEEGGERPISWSVSGLSTDAPPVTWTTSEGRERRAIASVFPVGDPQLPMLYARVVVMERRRGRWTILASPSLLQRVDVEPADLTIGGWSWQFSAATLGEPEPRPGAHLAVFAEEIVAGSVKVGVPGLEGGVCPDDPDLRDVGEGMMAILVFSHVEDSPGASVSYACQRQAADGTMSPFPVTLRVW